MRNFLICFILSIVFFSCKNYDSGINCEVKLHKGRPTLMINGKPEAPLLYALTDCPGGRWTWEEWPHNNLKKFADIGFHLFQVDWWLDDIWHADGTIDIELCQKQIRGVLAVSPNAAVFVRFHIDAPTWWNRKHPEECVQYLNKETKEYPEEWSLVRHTTLKKDLQNTKVHSLASEVWKKESTSVIQQMLRRLSATPEGNSLAGFHICDGVSHEWHYWGFIHNEADKSLPMTQYFRSWLKNKYVSDEALRKAWRNDTISLTSAIVPGMKEREFMSDGLFRDPQKERYVMDYYEAQQTVVAEDIIYFSRLIKETWPRKIACGVFYGYFFWLFSHDQQGGHLAVDKVLESPYVDYMSAPQSYYSEARDIGGGGQSRGILGSYKLHGKLSLEEMDQVTHYGGLCEKYWADQEKGIADSLLNDDIAYIQRSSIRPFMEGVGMWYYDFGPHNHSGWWDHPEYLKNIKKLKKIADTYNQKEYKFPADVLVVWDTKSYYAFKNSWSPISRPLKDDFSADLYRSGAVFENIFLFDLPKYDLSKIKTVIFTNTWQLDDKMKDFIKNNVAQNGRNLIWSYMPGYTNGDSLNTKFVSEVTGIQLERIHCNFKPDLIFNHPDFAKTEYGVKEAFNPMMKINDKEAVIIGTMNHLPAAGYKKFPTHTSWYCSLPWLKPALLTSILKKTGVHIYSHANDALIAGAGLIMINTKTGGKRSVHLMNGKTMEMELSPRSTVIVDSETGEIILR